MEAPRVGARAGRRRPGGLTVRPRGTLGLMFAADRVQDLLRRLREDIAALIHSEIDLAKTEVISKIKMHAKAAVADRRSRSRSCCSRCSHSCSPRSPCSRSPSRCWASALIVGGVLLLIAARARAARPALGQEGRRADARCRDRRGQGDRRGHQGGAHRVTSETERKRAEAQAARERLVGTVERARHRRPGREAAAARARSGRRAVRGRRCGPDHGAEGPAPQAVAPCACRPRPTSRSRRATRRRSSPTPRACSAASRDGERCLVAALAAGWREPRGRRRAGAAAGVVHGARARAVLRRARAARPAVTAEDTLDGGRRLRGDRRRRRARRAAARPTATCCCCATCTASPSALLEAVTDMSEADLENQLYRARAEFADGLRGAARARPLPRAPHATAPTAPSASACAHRRSARSCTSRRCRARPGAPSSGSPDARRQPALTA